MNNKISATAAIFGLLSIILGAFGAHALKRVLTAEQLLTFETGVKYQMYHALFLLFIAYHTVLSQKSKKAIFYLIATGTILFSGSIYVLATKQLTHIDVKSIGILTPIGGLFLLSGWGLFLIKTMQNKS